MRLDDPGELASGERHQVDKIWEDGEIKGFRFQDPVTLEQLLAESPGLPELVGSVRWRRTPLYGLNFEQAFRLDELARITAQLASAED